MASVATDWIDKVGIELAAGIIPQQTAKGLGLVSLEENIKSLPTGIDNPVENSEIIVTRVPRSVSITCTTIKHLAEFDSVLKAWIEFDKCEGNELLHRGLLYLWLSTNNNKWKGYFDTLPKDINLPFSYSIKDMQGLDFSAVSIHHMALMKRLAVEKAYERFMKAEISRQNTITLEQWLIPYQWILSRGLTHPQTGETAIVPAIDLCNHSSHHSNVRYDVDDKGNYELRTVASLSGPNCELLLNYGTRGISEFVFNYGFIPDDLSDDDLDQIYRVFDPADEEIRKLLDPSYDEDTDMSEDTKFEKSLTYDLQLEFFSEENSQILFILRLPKSAEKNEALRYRFRSNFIMFTACYGHLELRSVEDGIAIFLGDEQVLPHNVFQLAMAYGDREIIRKAKELVAKLCDYFCTQVSEVSDNNGIISQLAKSEANIYRQYAQFNGNSKVHAGHREAQSSQV